MAISLQTFVQRVGRARLSGFLTSVYKDLLVTCSAIDKKVDADPTPYSPKRAWKKGNDIYAALQEILRDRASEYGFSPDEKPDRPEIIVDKVKISGSRVRSGKKVPQFVIRQAEARRADQLELVFDEEAPVQQEQLPEQEGESMIEMVLGVAFGKRQKKTYYSEPSLVLVGALNDTRDGYAFPPIEINEFLSMLIGLESTQSGASAGRSAIVNFVNKQIDDLGNAEDNGIQQVE